MAIEITCTCGSRYRVKDELAGKKVKYKNCEAAIPVPVSEADVFGLARETSSEIRLAICLR
jgi:hypothetical protein